MMKECFIEGILVCKKGEAEVGSRVSVIRRIDISCFKDEVVVTGDNGFRGYPAEDSYIVFMELLADGYSIEGEILDIKKEGIYNASFCAFK